MYRSGRFEKPDWAAIELEHGPAWKALEQKYGLSPTYNVDWSLDRLAEDSIDKTSQLFFGMRNNTWDVHSLNCWTDYFCSPLFKKTPEEALYDRFSVALRDHLIVIFCHRFLCDNLIPKSFNECVDLVFNCTPESIDDKITLYSGSTVGELRKTFRKNIKTEFNAVKRMINTSVGLFADSSGIDIFYNTDELLLAPNWIFTFSTLQNTKRNPYRVENKRYQDQLEKRFRFAIERDQRNRVDTFVDFFLYIANNKFPRLLLPKEEKAQAILNCPYVPVKGFPEAWEIPYIHWCEKESKPFIGFTVQEGGEKTYKTLGPQTYRVRDREAHVTIPEEIQYAFNNYLLERNYHLGALMYIAHILQANPSGNDSEVRRYLGASIIDILSWALRLHSPILHRPFISLLDELLPSCAFSKPRLSWVKEVIDFWNTTALPVSEELFLWSVWKCCKDDPIAVFAAIEDAFFTDRMGRVVRESNDNRCNRLTIMRIVERPKKVRVANTNGHSIDEGVGISKRIKNKKACEDENLGDYLVRTALSNSALHTFRITSET